MANPKWLLVAKNEYRVNTSGLGSFRRLLPVVLTGIVAAYVFVLAPVMVRVFVSDFVSYMLGVAAVPVVQIVLTMFFFYMILFPISNTLREAPLNQREIYLAAPIKASDVLFGEFLSRVPFYSVAIAIVSGTFLAFVQGLGLSIVQNLVLILVFILTFLPAVWIGTVFSALIKGKLEGSAKGRDVGRALSLVVALPLVAVMYSFIGGGMLNYLSNPSASGPVRLLLDVLPSSWGAQVFVSFARSPGNLEAVALEALARVGGLALFGGACLWIGTRAVTRSFNLEPASMVSPQAKRDGFFYGSVKMLGGGGSSGGILVATFKEYGRTLENLSLIFYTIALSIMVSVFLADPFQGPRDPLLFMSEFMLPMLSAFIVGTISRGKEALFVYKQVPKGVDKFVKARLQQAWLVAVPIAMVAMIVSTALTPQSAWTHVVTNAAVAVLRTLVNVVLGFAVALLIPVFAEESRERMFGLIINVLALTFTAIGLEIGLTRMGFSIGKLAPGLDIYTRSLVNNLMQTAIILVLGTVLLLVGKRKLDGIE